MKLTFVLGFASFAALSQAAVFEFRADLDGAQEVPSVVSPVTGRIFFKVDDSTMKITTGTGKLSQTFSSALSGFHIHTGAVGVNGPIIVNIGTAAISGTTIAFSNLTINTVPQLDAMKNGGTYFNIHTTSRPGGEIRGQIELVPEPGTLIALAAGLSALGARRRRRG